jgi:mono/diheme cytochrome c family protein
MMRAPAALLALLALAACDDQSMRVQKRYTADSPAALWPDGTSSRPLPDGVASVDADRQEQALSEPRPVTPDLLARGRERYEIACAPCHGLSGKGDGIIVSRGFPAPPSYGEPRLRAADGRHFVDVITHGYGVMYPYAARVAPRDRWAIAAYIRALQASQAVRVAQVPGLREKLP